MKVIDKVKRMSKAILNFKLFHPLVFRYNAGHWNGYKDYSNGSYDD